jgi:hypothetical protein
VTLHGVAMRVGFPTFAVMPGFMPGIHVLFYCRTRQTWLAGTSPAMTAERLETSR